VFNAAQLDRIRELDKRSVRSTLTACPYDNMYKTVNASADCYSGNSYDRISCQTDNADFTVWIHSPTLSQADKDNIIAFLDLSLTTTNINVQYHANPVTSGAAETDLIYRQISTGIPSGSLGVTFCDDAISNTKCDQHYINFTEDITTVPRSLACHESGHAVGLLHGFNAEPQVPNDDPTLGCMGSGMPIGSLSQYLGTQNINMINGTYS
jgi:hypothetical protein